MTVKEYTARLGISKRLLADIKFGGGDLLVNGEHVTVRTVLADGDVLKIEFPKEHVSETLLPEPVPLDILYEDDHVLVVNKQPYVSSIPSREHPSESIANGVISHYRKSGVQSTVHLVTRLDRDTSGGDADRQTSAFPFSFVGGAEKGACQQAVSRCRTRDHAAEGRNGGRAHRKKTRQYY